jgi:ATP-dependent Clp protease ATP-binding subunit ClpA
MDLSIDLEESLRIASKEASSRSHEFVTLEHLLYALTFNEEVKDILLNLGGNIDNLRRELRNFLDQELSAITRRDKNIQPKYTVGVQFILQFAALHVQNTGKELVRASNVFIALFREEDSYAVYFLSNQSIKRRDVIRYVTHGISKQTESDFFEPDIPDMDSGEDLDSEDEGDESGGSSGKDPFQKFCTNMVEKAKEGKIDPCIGRDLEIERTIHILSRRRKNNPIFVGDAGVGKTAIAEGLALRVAEGKVPKSLETIQIYSVDMGAMLAGTKFRGDFEERLKYVMDRASKDSNIILFFDEIHTIVGAGAVSGGSMDASNILKPALTNGSLRVIGTTTFRECKSIFEKDHALSRRFQKIDVDEPSLDETVQILNGLRSKYEEFHKVEYSPNSIRAAVDLSVKYLMDRKLPDKAIDIMDESGALVKLRWELKQKSPNPENGLDTESKLPKVSKQDMESVVSKMAKVPIETVKPQEKKKIQDLESELKKKIFGQDLAVQEVSEAVMYSLAGMGDDTKPVGSFLFAGPTGVGKTELAKSLAELIEVPLLRFDMSEYMERHSISRLIGSPPGYVGHGETALLTDEIRKNPHSLILIDEIEKAHEDIFNLFLQIMDYGTLTDAMGRKTDFRKTIIIFTTNSGAKEKSTGLLGFGERVSEDDRTIKAIERQFSPEFRNRLSGIIQFSSLGTAEVERIIDKAVRGLENRLRPKKVRIEISELAKLELAKAGFDPDLGARPITRMIENRIGKPISKEILFGNLQSGGTVFIDWENGNLSLRFTSLNSK